MKKLKLRFVKWLLKEQPPQELVMTNNTFTDCPEVCITFEVKGDLYLSEEKLQKDIMIIIEQDSVMP